MLDFNNEKLSQVLYDVERVPLYTMVDGEYKQVVGRSAIARTDTNAVLGYMTDRYMPMSNREVLINIDDLLTKSDISYQIGKCVSIGNGQLAKIEIILPDFEVKTRGGSDASQLRMYVDNSFNGLTTIKTQMGFFRQVCSNGMVVGNVEKQYSIAHLGDVTKKTITSFQEFLDKKFIETQKYVDDLVATDFVSENQVEKFIREDSQIVADKYRKTIEDVWKSKYERSRNAWYVLNSFTEVITHDVKCNLYAKMDMYNRLRRESLKWMNDVIDVPLESEIELIEN
jgi:hypothetical protein